MERIEKGVQRRKTYEPSEEEKETHGLEEESRTEEQNKRGKETKAAKERYVYCGFKKLCELFVKTYD